MTPQGESGLKGPSTATPGGTIEVEVGPNDQSVEISLGGSGDTQSFEVPPDKKVSIPVPSAPPGSVVKVSVGDGLSRRIILVEIIAPSP